jgi:hypothetical protein
VSKAEGLKYLRGVLEHLNKYKSRHISLTKDTVEEMHNHYIELEQENAKLKERLKDAESVIKFYATPSVWGIASPSDMTSIDPCDVGDFFHQEIGVTSRGGKRAREYFKK